MLLRLSVVGVSLRLHYDGKVVGEYFADLFVTDTVIVELKAVKEISETFAPQCLNFVKAAG